MDLIMAGWSDFLSPIVSGLAGAAGVAILAQFGLRSKPDRHGWRRIRPSAMHWTALIGSAAIACLVLYIRLFVGSARADAAQQMVYAELLVAGFAIGTLVSLWQIRRILRTNAFWRGSTLCFDTADGRDAILPMTEVAQMDRRWSGTVDVRFSDGTLLRLDQYATGVPELWNRIVEVNEQLDDEA
jgi:hypothetical protein